MEDDGRKEALRCIKDQWRKEQKEMEKRLILNDDFPWGLGPEAIGGLKLIGGLDISFVKDSATTACAMYVILSFPALEVVYSDKQMVELTAPYISGFLAFREAPFLLELIDRQKATRPDLTPQILMFDGNGVLHHRGCGVACHIGYLADIPSIGVAKTLLAIDGFNPKEIIRRSREFCKKAGDAMPLVGSTGRMWGYALRCTEDSVKPVYVSAGHRISQETALEVVKMVCQFRVPAPIREADLRSREAIRHYLAAQKKKASGSGSSSSRS